MKVNTKIGVAIALVAGLAFTGCGDDDTSSNNGTTNNGATNNGATNNGATNNGATNNGATNNGATNNGTPVVEAPPKCGDADEPARCSADPATVVWDTASIFSSLAIAGEDDECCFDFTGDGEINNSLGVVLGALGLDDLNASLQESIDDGTVVAIFEHQGLTDVTGGEFTVNFWLGEWDGITALDAAGSNGVLIDPAAIDAGAQPQAYLPAASIANNMITAGPGMVVLTLDILGAALTVAITQASIEADVNASSAIDTGVALDNGKLGGVIKIEDLITGVNTFASGCSCLGVSGDLVEYDASTGLGTCADTSANTCVAGTDDTCITIADNCGTIVGFLPLLADVDTDGDGDPDGVSLGTNFETYGAIINGLAQ